MRYLISLLLFIAILLAGFINNVHKVEAYTEGSVLGSSVFSPDYKLYVDGNNVDNPNSEITTEKNNPNFFGYTIPNSTVILTIQNSNITAKITSNNKGYWIYSFEKPFSPGQYKLYLSLKDRTGASTPTALVATFKVPNKQGNIGNTISIPQVSITQLNYLTVSLIVIGSVIVLLIIYRISKLHHHPHI